MVNIAAKVQSWERLVNVKKQNCGIDGIDVIDAIEGASWQLAIRDNTVVGKMPRWR